MLNAPFKKKKNFHKKRVLSFRVYELKLILVLFLTDYYLYHLALHKSLYLDIYKCLYEYFNKLKISRKKKPAS